MAELTFNVTVFFAKICGNLFFFSFCMMQKIIVIWTALKILVHTHTHNSKYPIQSNSFNRIVWKRDGHLEVRLKQKTPTKIWTNRKHVNRVNGFSREKANKILRRRKKIYTNTCNLIFSVTMGISRYVNWFI